MNILVSGASGLIGKEITHFFTQQGHRVIPLCRNTRSAPAYWDIEAHQIHIDANLQIDIVINLAGENIVKGRWTKAKKERIKSSRVQGTKLLASYFANAAHRPLLFISGSAIGYYGDRDEEILSESSCLGDGFLAEVCNEWEAATVMASQAGIRVVNLRFGMVLSNKGGALQKMILPFTMGLGGKIGNGRQYMSWISITDVVCAILHIINHPELDGPVNLVAPDPVTNDVFTKTLGKTLHRPTFLPLPAFAAKILFGEMAQALLLASTRVVPDKLQKSGYCFKKPTLAKALQQLIATH